ncbi:hypothetical protein A3A20_00785 [Candidatus Wolfebacteria bacterium RIFCSPLOWO2_01_FULL_45_19]|uniref:Serine protease n=1 Tax=Candidatus Wolfebacteria bacterium RIFCSPLOWO2_01_FULL_45_19 TaxID=1802557 RepID=A0A1F8DPS3_9BACT|nr:MAG: hypothetical protein UX23_C0009G0016 [Parcubacteria group bacterium GW2011_GWB1_45_9]OGM90633.1 MAG: hypothetical protein A3A20_00785 [Candidatus Wolfebacteria bacterium RIFCSPLOWO2_01_FULL_45_19]
MLGFRARAGPFVFLSLMIAAFSFFETARADHENIQNLLARIPKSIIEAENLALEKGVPSAVVGRFRAVTPIVVEITAFSKEYNYGSSGSGVLIADDLVLSALHIFPAFEELISSKRLRVRVFINGEIVLGYIPDKRYYDIKSDLVAIKLLEKIPIVPVPIAQNDPAVGETVYSFGYAILDRPVRLNLEYVGDTYNSGQRYLVTTRSYEHGYSGSLLFNARGEAIGVAAMASERGAFGFTVPWETVLEFLKKIPEFKS